jgi:hypothetical protein
MEESEILIKERKKIDQWLEQEVCPGEPRVNIEVGHPQPSRHKKYSCSGQYFETRVGQELLELPERKGFLETIGIKTEPVEDRN